VEMFENLSDIVRISLKSKPVTKIKIVEKPVENVDNYDIS